MAICLVVTLYKTISLRLPGGARGVGGSVLFETDPSTLHGYQTE